MADNKTPKEFAQKRASDKLFGFKIRTKLFPGEDKFFSDRPEVAGMASQDDTIILNPYSPLSKKQLGSVAQNEALRLKMRKEDFTPSIDITDEQKAFFKGTEYEKDLKAMRQTIFARIYSGDSSAMATPEQKKSFKEYLSDGR
tara:strand:- start:435 stop:863 length:429 start_codon:yes stop_codon:yes gene_type:complete